MAENAIEKFIEEMDEWDTIFDPTDKPEYSHAQLVRFAKMWAEKEIIEELEKIIDNPFNKVPLKVAERIEELEKLN